MESGKEGARGDLHWQDTQRRRALAGEWPAHKKGAHRRQLEGAFCRRAAAALLHQQDLGARVRCDRRATAGGHFKSPYLQGGHKI